ncbi:MAG: hypothetical protein GY838_13660 [bacterium]|nr:hypothetical protein [bacterium]
MRGYYKVSGPGGDPLASGHVTIQIDKGSGWEVYAAGKNVQPYRIVGMAVFVPASFYTPILYGHGTAGAYKVRAKADWVGGPYYSNEIAYTLVGATRSIPTSAPDRKRIVPDTMNYRGFYRGVSGDTAPPRHYRIRGR